MAIAVAVDGGEIRLALSVDREIEMTASIDDGVEAVMPLLPPAYTGEVVFTPSDEAQTIHTANLMVGSDITITPIPSNYGRITWDGRTITVS